LIFIIIRSSIQINILILIGLRINNIIFSAFKETMLGIYMGGILWGGEVVLMWGWK
jgi:hypothetical protein